MLDPDSSIWLSVAVLTFFLALTTFVAAAQTALTTLNRTYLQTLGNHGISRRAAIETLLNDTHRSMVTLLILNGLGLIGSASAAVFLIGQLVLSIWLELLLLFVLALFIVTLAQIVPKAWAASHPEQVVTAIAGSINVITTLMMPIVHLLDLVSRGINRLSGRREPPVMDGLMMSEEALLLLVGAGEEEGLIEEEEKEMIAGIFELGQTLAREVMVPRISIVAVEANTAFLDALSVIIEAGHSRIPVYDDNIDNIIGILYAKDLLTHLRDGQTDIPIRDIVREPYFIPESKHVDDLLKELQQRKVHIAIVVDEYGGTAGLVTIEDLIEEIVGEIQDEYDQEEPYVEQISENEIIFNARVDVDDVNRLMSIDLPTDHGDTLGGLVFSELGKIPEPGDRIELNGVTIVVLSVIDRQIQKVRLTRDRRDQASAEEQATEPHPATRGRRSGELIEDTAA